MMNRMKKVYGLCITVLLVMIIAAGCISDDLPGDVSGKWDVDFLDRPVSNGIRISDESDVVITNLCFRDMDDVAIYISRCRNVEISECDFANLAGGIYIVDSENVKITRNRFSDIGDGTIGGGHSNYIQLNRTYGGYIANNKGRGGNTEDVISIHMSGGVSESDPLVIEYNHFEGDGWISSSGSGINVGDNGGRHTVVRYNTLLSPGQIGIGVSSGVDIHIVGNTVYSGKVPNSNAGIILWNQYDTPMEDIEIADNSVKWLDKNGRENPYWNGEKAANHRDFTPEGEETNNWHANIDPKKIKVEL